MMHVFADFTDPRGSRIEGRGAVPDVVLPLTRADLLAGRDLPVDSALAWIARGRPAPAAGASGTAGSGAAAP
jgi:C-terminal processing protease CtpA/Prc